MQMTFHIPVPSVVPTIESVLRAQGVPAAVTPSDQVNLLAERAASIYTTLARPAGIAREIPLEQFQHVLVGEGRNSSSTPVENTARRAEKLALFVVTVGADLTQEIQQLFRRQDFPLAAMLDAHASEGAELAAAQLEGRFVESLTAAGHHDTAWRTIRYSPGYCGWHVSGQRRLFEFLQPESIGVTLRESFLMDPLKSISGVLITGEKEIFDFDNTFPFCDDCVTWSCRDRINAILGR